MSKLTYFLLFFLVFSIPNEYVLTLPGFGTISRVVGVLTGVCALVSIFVDNRFRAVRFFHLLLTVFVLFSIASFFWTIDNEMSKNAIVTLVQLYILVWLVWEFSRDIESQNKLMVAYVFGAFVSACGLLLSYHKGQEVTFFRYSAFGFDPNDQGLMLTLAVPFAWYVFLVSKNISVRISSLLYIPVAIFGVFLTASRGSVVCLIVSMVFVFFTIPRLHVFGNFSLFCFISLGGLFLLERIPKYSLDRVSTLGGDLLSGNLNSRTNIWLNGLRAFSEKPLFGSGIGTFQGSIEPHIGTQISPHNLFLSILVGQGLIGLFLFLICIGFLCFFINKMDSLRIKLWLTILMVWGLGVMTLGWELRKPTYFLIGLLAAQIFSENKPTVKLKNGLDVNNKSCCFEK